MSISVFAAPVEVAVITAVVGLVAMEVGLPVLVVKPDRVAGVPVADS